MYFCDLHHIHCAAAVLSRLRREVTNWGGIVMSLYSDRILGMSAAHRLNLAVVGLIAATSVGVAEPTALVESVVTQSASANVMSYVETGKTFRLGTEDTMTLSYPDACLRETITGRTVTIGRVRRGTSPNSDLRRLPASRRRAALERTWHQLRRGLSRSGHMSNPCRRAICFS
jgi:hypothetical protein